MHSSMGDFNSMSEHPSPAEMQRLRRRFSAPDNEAPVAVAASTVIGRSPNAAVVLTFVLAYSTGAEFGVAVRTRTPEDRRRNPLHQLFSGMGADEIDANRAFLLGVHYADGRRAITYGKHGMPRPPGEDSEQSPTLALGSSSGSDNSYDLQFWLSPLPLPGPLTMVFRWPEFDIDETTVILDGADIAAAGRAAVELWPPEFPDEPASEPPTPGLPDSGWFAGQD